MKKINTFSPLETIEVGRKLGQILQRGDLVCISGDLGAGKTVFTKGIAKELGIKGYVTSPTFTIVNEYEGKIPFYHLDVYRINNKEEILEIGFEEYLYGGGVLAIEWPELLGDLLPYERISVNILLKNNELPEQREITINFFGNRYLNYENKLKDKGEK